MNLFNRILKSNFELFDIKPNSYILDVGCGNGDGVETLRELGFNAYGIDVEFKEGEHKNKLENSLLIRRIEIGNKSRASLSSGDSYVWPEFDNAFDVIVSRAVLEHVRNLEEFVISSKQALNPKTGICLHYYPSKFSLIEPHTGVPLGALIQNRAWFKIMCKLKLCFKTKRNKGDEAFNYMLNFTTFRKQNQIDSIFKRHGFEKANSIDVLSCHPSSAAQFLGKFSLFNFLFGLFRSKVVAYRLD